MGDIEPISDEQLAEIAALERRVTINRAIQVGAPSTVNACFLSAMELYGKQAKSFPALLSRMCQAGAREKRYREALDWYADWKNWMANPNVVTGDMEPAARRDMGHVARVAIGMTPLDEHRAEMAARAALKETGHE